jgi:hypothetical protein
MKVPKNLLIIGPAHLVRFRRTGSRAHYQAQDRHCADHLLAINATQNTLYIFPNRTTGKKEILKDRKGLQRGYIHTATEYEIPTLNLRKIGTVDALQYSTAWWQDELTKYEHIFDTTANFYANQYSRFTVMAIKLQKGKKILNNRGVTG